MTDRLALIGIDREGAVDLPSKEAPAELQGVLAATRNLYAERGFTRPWICYIAIEAGRVVGTCGFTSPPMDGKVEIAYFTFPDHEGRGIATTMAEALLDIAASARDDVLVTACTLPERNASHRILEKLGFRTARAFEHPEDGTVLEWYLDKQGTMQDGAD